MVRKGKFDRRILKEVVRRVARAAKPEKIILFGSAARGTCGPHSDLDLLVIKRGKFDHHRLSEAVYTELLGSGAAVDVVFATPEEVEQYRNEHCLIIAPALKEGIVVYGA